MVFRLTRVRIKAEWLLMIIALVLLILYIRFCSADIRNSTDLYSYTQFEYRYTANLSSYDELSGVGKSSADPVMVARAYGIDPRELPEKADLRDIYDLVIRNNWNYLYKLIMSSGVLFAFPVLDGLAMLLLCPLFRKRRIGQYLSAGFSRKQVFLSFTLLYFGCAVVMWLLGSFFQLARFRIPFGAFLGDQLVWLCAVLFGAALAYLAAVLLRRPIVAFFASLAVWIPLLFCFRGLLPLPLAAVGFTLAFLAAVLAVSWLHFRKRGFAA